MKVEKYFPQIGHGETHMFFFKVVENVFTLCGTISNENTQFGERFKFIVSIGF